MDYRSDTITQPTKAMRQAMMHAIVGDDVYQEDPTTKRLEHRVKELFRKEAALFLPSGTMSNLCATLAWSKRSDYKRSGEIILGDQSHMFLYEQGGAAMYGGLSYRAMPQQKDGSFDYKSGMRPDDDIHEPRTQLLCLENTWNGRPLDPDFLKEANAWSKKMSVPIHMDGARIWNAMTALDIPTDVMGQYADSISVCLSKGLGAPIGSVLVGPADFIESARRIRKSLGGGMRQSGVLAAAGLVAIDDYFANILQQDHRRATWLTEGIVKAGFRIHSSFTNMVFVEVPNAEKLALALKEKGVRVTPWSSTLIRMVLHRDITDAMVEETIHIFKQIAC
jgi:threonine aldolase